MKGKRLFSVIVCAALILALTPITARAADVTIVGSGIYELSADDTTINVKTTDPVTIDGQRHRRGCW